METDNGTFEKTPEVVVMEQDVTSSREERADGPAPPSSKRSEF